MTEKGKCDRCEAEHTLNIVGKNLLCAGCFIELACLGMKVEAMPIGSKLAHTGGYYGWLADAPDSQPIAGQTADEALTFYRCYPKDHTKNK